MRPRALVAFQRATRLGEFRAGVPTEVWVAVQITALLAEDCRPCVQLGVQLAQSRGVGHALLEALVTGAEDELPGDVALAVRFTRAVLDRSTEADAHRQALLERFGQLGLVSLAFAMTSARLYPTVKCALGYGNACSRVVIGDRALAPLGLAKKSSGAVFSIEPLRVNGLPGAIVWRNGALYQTVAFDVEEGSIVAIHAVRNPEKLGHLAPMEPPQGP